MSAADISDATMESAVKGGVDEAAADLAPEVAEMAGGKRSKWMAHVRKTMKSHKGKSLKQVLKLAAKSYKSKGGSYLTPSPAGGPGPLTGGRRHTRRSTKGKKGRKGSRRH